MWTQQCALHSSDKNLGLLFENRIPTIRIEGVASPDEVRLFMDS